MLVLNRSLNTYIRKLLHRFEFMTEKWSKAQPQVTTILQCISIHIRENKMDETDWMDETYWEMMDWRDR